MKGHGVNLKYIRIMKKIYENSTAVIQMEKKSRTFKIGRGVKQGCCLSPKKVFENLDWSQKGLNIDGKKLNELRFADDVIVFSKKKDELLTMMSQLFEESKKAGLNANIGKTKIMCNTGEKNFTLNGKQIETVNEYKYLGSLVSFENHEMKEVNARIAGAWRSFWALGKYFQSNMPVFYKKRLMDSCILPILTYGCQCWNFTEHAMEKLAVEQRNMERKMMKIKKKAKFKTQK
jgi:Reverse transcriptase (RNA-dependent DNA polymerase)